MLSVNN